VAFNGTNATSIVSWNATQIVAVVPTGATTGNVVVTVSGHASNGSNFTVNIQGVCIGGEVWIGTQIWSCTNLAVTTYRDGSTIPQVTDPTAWSNLTTGAWCYYNNDPSMGPIYGKLYNWYAVNDPRGLAPTGWHVPSEAEWTTLTTYLGGESVAGGKLKETGYTHWQSPNTGATNESGFSALPGGYRNEGGTFADIGLRDDWWSSTEYLATTAWYSWVNYSNATLSRDRTIKGYGFSVRLIKD
ncbi:MAG: FISUMP domain-containing protein, partial [Bacteroidota bacterium]